MSERLPRIPQGLRLVMPDGRATQAFQRFWERMCQEIEAGRSRMDSIANVTVYADYTGAALDGQLPRLVTAKRYFMDDDVTSSSTWSVEVVSGSVTCTMDSGVIEITAVGAASSVVKATSVRGGLTLYETFTVTRSTGTPPAGTTGSASDDAFASISSASHAAISDELTVTVAASGEVALSAPLTVTTANASPAGTFEVYGKWQWWNGLAWEDVAAETASSPDCTVAFESELPPSYQYQMTQEGSLSVATSKTGLTPSASEKFRLTARNDSGTRTMYFSGTASAVSS